MKERPILFSAPMVRALLNGTKTQTRRAVKSQFATDAVPCEMGATNECGHQISGHSGVWWCDAERNHEKAVRCPYGLPGDRLWVRESFWLDRDGVAYKADQESGSPWLEAGAHKAMKVGANGTPYVSNWGWRPSIHMPRWASRITLEVTGVRVERLQDISEADARAEGAVPADPCDHTRRSCKEIGCDGPLDYVGGYRTLWEQINGPSSWDTNPWVWVLEFNRLEAA